MDNEESEFLNVSKALEPEPATPTLGRSQYQPAPRNRKVPFADEFEERVLVALEKEDNGKEMAFFTSIMPAIKKFNNREFVRFQTRVLQAVSLGADATLSPPSRTLSSSSSKSTPDSDSEIN